MKFVIPWPFSRIDLYRITYNYFVARLYIFPDSIWPAIIFLCFTLSYGFLIHHSKHLLIFFIYCGSLIVRVTKDIGWIVELLFFLINSALLQHPPPLFFSSFRREYNKLEFISWSSGLKQINLILPSEYRSNMIWSFEDPMLCKAKAHDAFDLNFFVPYPSVYRCWSNLKRLPRVSTVS